MWTTSARRFTGYAQRPRPKPPAGRSGHAHHLPCRRLRAHEGHQVRPGGRDFVFAGWNQWEVLEAASDALPPFRHLPLPGREHVVRLMNEAVENTKVGASEDPFLPCGWTDSARSRSPFPTPFPGPRSSHVGAHHHPWPRDPVSLGVWNEDILRGMDFISPRRGSADSRSYGASVRHAFSPPALDSRLTFSNLRRVSDARRRAVADNWHPWASTSTWSGNRRRLATRTSSPTPARLSCNRIRSRRR